METESTREKVALLVTIDEIVTTDGSRNFVTCPRSSNQHFPSDMSVNGAIFTTEQNMYSYC